jgi:NADPH:quinone reductase-like Zn-dependent oxidoreductase
MRVLELHDSFGLDHLRFTDRREPKPGPGQVLLRMRAASLNYRDLLMIEGKYNPRQPLPLVPLSDGVGEVIALGAGVRRVAVGDRVAPIFAQHWFGGVPDRDRLRATLGGPLDGVMMEHAVFAEESVVLVPDHLSDVEAATLPCAALTAWSALMHHGHMQPGETVLVQGTGGVATFALQFAVLAGARVIVTSRSDAKLEHARSHGAWETIQTTTTPAWGKRALELTSGAGVDHVIEVGGADTFAQSLLAVRPGGHIAVIGILGGTALQTSLLPILMKQLRVQGVLVGHRDGFEAMIRAIGQHGMRPVLDRVFDWQDTAQALAYLKTGSHIGKVGLRIA